MKMLNCVVAVLAVSTAAAAEYTVTCADDDPGNAGSLRAIVSAAASEDTVYLPAALGPYTLSAEIYFGEKMLRLVGTGDGRAVIAGGNGNRLFTTGRNQSGPHLVFENLEFRGGDATSGTDPANGNAAPRGGVLFQRDGYTYVDFVNCVFEGNRAEEGGALYFSKTAYVTMTDCMFRGNDASVSGGAIVLGGNRPVIGMTNCVFEANTALANGAIGGAYGDIFARDCVFADNAATNNAGAFFVQNSSVMMERTVFRGNRCLGASTTAGSGAVAGGNKDKHFIFRDCLFTNNVSYSSQSNSGCGGAATGGTNWTNLYERCTFVDNHKPNGMGGALGTRTDLELRDCLFKGNTCGNGGGGALWQYNGKLDIRGCIFEGNGHFDVNNFSGGAAIYHRSSADMVISNTIFRANATLNPAQGYSGALGEFSDVHKSTLVDCLFEDNFAYRGGSAIQTGFAMDVVNCVFKGNRGRLAPTIGFGSGTKDRPLNLVNCTFVGNESGRDETDEATGQTTVYNGYGALYVTCGNHENDLVSARHCTFVGNTSDGAAFHLNNTSSSPVTLSDSVFLGNRDWTGKVRDLNSTFESIDHTVTEQAYGGTGGFTMTATETAGNHFGDDLALGDLKLETELADNGTKKTFLDGSHLQTLAITGRSPLRGAASNSDVATDARGFARDESPDIGAFEFQVKYGFLLIVR